MSCEGKGGLNAKTKFYKNSVRIRDHIFKPFLFLGHMVIQFVICLPAHHYFAVMNYEQYKELIRETVEYTLSDCERN
jgi:hypothetical protein